MPAAMPLYARYRSAGAENDPAEARSNSFGTRAPDNACLRRAATGRTWVPTREPSVHEPLARHVVRRHRHAGLRHRAHERGTEPAIEDARALLPHARAEEGVARNRHTQDGLENVVAWQGGT